MRSVLALALPFALLLALAAPGTAGAQETRPRAYRFNGVQVYPQGWIGISLQIVDSRGRVVSGEETGAGAAIVISGVVAGSPAEEAGFAVGDTILELDGAEATPENLRAFVRELQPGEPVQFTVLRDGQRQRIEVVPGTRGHGVIVRPEIFVRIDSIRGAIARSLDSSRIELQAVVAGMDTNRLDMVEVQARTDSLRNRLVYPKQGVAVYLHPDSLSVMLRVGEFQERLRDRRELADSLNRALIATARENQEGLRKLQEVRLDSARASALRAQARALDEIRVAGDSIRELEEARWHFRPLTAYVVGQRAVAGASLTDLNPGLAEYFDARSGVLVTDVARGTPAEDAGLAPGDVITGVGGEPVETIEDLRERLRRVTARQGPLTLTLVRKGREVEVRLPE